MSFSALTRSISPFNLAKFPSTGVIELPLCETDIPLIHISDLSSSDSAAPAMAGEVKDFVGSSNMSGIVFIAGTGDIVEERGETAETDAVFVELWPAVSTIVRYDGTVTGLYGT
jgi:hypothetical protein